MNLKSKFRSQKQLDVSLDEEMQFHIERETEKNIALGMTADAARKQALMDFGGLSQTKDAVRAIHWSSFWESLLHDVRFGIRILQKTPVTTTLVLLIFALGIGGTTALFSIVNTVLLRPLPYRDPARIVLLNETWQGKNGNVSVGNWHDWREQATSFEHLALLTYGGYNLTSGGSTQRVTGAAVSADFFNVFGVAPALGRLFTAADETGDAVVISDGLWRSMFNARPDVLGTKIDLDGRFYSIVGVVPPHFDPLAGGEQVWVPASFKPAELQQHDGHAHIVVGRLKPTSSMAAAQAEMDAITKRLEQAYPRDDAGRGALIRPLATVLVEDYRPALLLLLATTGFLLLIACANIVNLQLARAAARDREIATRAALGASALRITRQLLVESMVLSLAGGVFGLVVAHLATRWLVTKMPGDVPRLSETNFQPATFLFCLVLTVACGVLCGLGPALRSRSLALGDALNSRGTGSSELGRRDWFRKFVVVAQSSLTLLLLAGAGLLIRSALNLNGTDPGFDPKHLISARVPLPRAYSDPEKLANTFREILAEAQRLPGVQSAALDSRAPLGGGNQNGLIPEGVEFRPENAILARFQMISPEFFATMKIPLKAGRGFSALDHKGSGKVMIINETLARTAFGSAANALGKRIGCCEDDPNGGAMMKEVVGVVGDVHSAGLQSDPTPEFYLPIDQVPADAWHWVRNSLDIVVRVKEDPSAPIAALRALVSRIAPGTPIATVAPMEEQLSDSISQSRFVTQLLTIFASLALVLAALGIYGVLSYSVAQRKREIGIRMAMGAQLSDVRGLIVNGGLKLTGIGLICGTVGALALGRLLNSFLYHVQSHDPATLIGVGTVLLAVGFGASYIPAWRASKLDPATVLRSD